MSNVFYARCHSRILARTPENTKHIFVYIQTHSSGDTISAVCDEGLV